MWGKEAHWNFRQGKLKLLAAGKTAFSRIHTEHTILQVGFTLLWKDQYRSNFYYCYYQNMDLGLTQVLCHKPSSCSLCSLIHEVPQLSYFNNSLAGITTGVGFFLLTILALDLPRHLKSYFYSWASSFHFIPLYYMTLNNCGLLMASLNPVFHLKETKTEIIKIRHNWNMHWNMT